MDMISFVSLQPIKEKEKEKIVNQRKQCYKLLDKIINWRYSINCIIKLKILRKEADIYET